MYHMRELYRKDVELIPVNDEMITDITADIRKENDAWYILLTVFLEVTQNDEFENIVATVTSTLNISQNMVISNNNEVTLHEKYANITVQLIVPTVNATAFTEI